MAVYEGNLGFQEMMTFYQVAPKREQTEMNRLLGENKFDKAWSLLKRVVKKDLGSLAKHAARAGTDSAQLYVISPKMLAALIVNEKWINTWEEYLDRGPKDYTKLWGRMDKLIRQHGGAVIYTGADGIFDVTVPDEEGFMPIVGEKGLLAPYGEPGFNEAIKKVAKTAGWMDLEGEFATGLREWLSSHTVIIPWKTKEKSVGLINAIPGGEDNDKGLFTGDSPWDAMDKAVEDIDLIYRRNWGRSVTPEELVSVFNFSAGRVLRGDPLNEWISTLSDEMKIPEADLLNNSESWDDLQDVGRALKYPRHYIRQQVNEILQRPRYAALRVARAYRKKTAGWWAITPEGGQVPPPVDKGKLMNAVPGIDGADQALYNGDWPADIMGDALDHVDLAYRKTWGRPPNPEELQSVFKFVSHPVIDGIYKVNQWVDLVMERFGLSMEEVLADEDTWDALRAADRDLRNADRKKWPDGESSPQSLGVFDRKVKKILENKMSHSRTASATPLEMEVNTRKGYALIRGGGNIREITEALNKTMVRNVPPPQNVSKIPGARKAFSFHWSNAQNKWDVISVAKSLPWGLDGAEFVVFVGKDAFSPVDKLWTLSEMRYVAHGLMAHPGSSFAVRAARVAARYVVKQAALSSRKFISELVTFAKKSRTWFEVEGPNEHPLIFGSNKHGGQRAPGNKDLLEVKRLGTLFQKKYGDSVSLEVDWSEDYVFLTVTVEMDPYAPLSPSEKIDLEKAFIFAMDEVGDGGTLPRHVSQFMKAGWKQNGKNSRLVIKWFITNAKGSFS